MDYQFIPLTEAMHGAWDAFVKSNAWAWPGHRRGAIEIEELLGHPSCSHLVLDKKNRVVAVAPLFKTEMTLARAFKFRVLASGTQLRGGPLIAHGMSERRRRRLWSAVAEWLHELARNEGVDQVCLSFPHMMGEAHNSSVYPYHPLKDWGAEEKTNLSVICDLRPAEDKILAEMCGSQRQLINKAKRVGPEFFEFKARQDWLEAYPLNVATYEKEEVTPFTQAQLALAWDRFVAEGCGHAFGVRYRGKLAHAVLTIGTPYSQYVWMSFSVIPRLFEGGCQWEFWHTMCELKAKGVKWMELGTLEFGSEKMKGIGEFKRRFGPVVFRSLDGVLDLNPLKTTTATFVQAAARSVKSHRLVFGCQALYRRLRPPQPSPELPIVAPDECLQCECATSSTDQDRPAVAPVPRAQPEAAVSYLSSAARQQNL